ncbi:MAG TPA: hypothetical protein ENK32_00160 [Anaerolineae bacterium]|nr:hypothetical protein [Anaerolineae bacterium]
MPDLDGASPALLAAQQRLLQLQRMARERRRASGQDAGEVDHGRIPPPSPSPLAQLSLPPPHLGWESERVTAVLRQTKKRQTEQEEDVLRIAYCVEEANTQYAIHNTQTIKLYPDVALGMLRQEKAAAGRIWLLLRHLDEAGRGWIEVDAAREQLTRKGSPWRVCGWRQLRNLLNAGENIFWTRRDGRIWLKSTTKAAQALGVTRLQNRPVALPVTALLGTIGETRAHLYASFHSGRADAPISRAALEEISGMQRRTQRRYEQTARGRKRRNFAIGGPAAGESGEERAWRQGNAAFQLKDYQGKQGAAGKTYLAWQLPNSYAGPHAVAAKGRQKRINRELTDLFMQGMTGNGQDFRLTRRFCGNGRSAAKLFSKTGEEVYWRGKEGVWHPLGC